MWFINDYGSFNIFNTAVIKDFNYSVYTPWHNITIAISLDIDYVSCYICSYFAALSDSNTSYQYWISKSL